MDNRTFTRVLLALIAAEILAVLLASSVCADWPALPSAVKSWPDLPAVGKTIDLPVTAEVRKEPVKKIIKRVWGLVPCATCPSGFRYDWIETEVEEATDEAKANAAMDKFAAGKLTKEEAADLKATVASETIRKVMGQRWSLGTCRMICESHGSQLFNIFDDGTEELVEPAPDQPGEGGADAGRRRWLRGRR